MLKTRLLLTLVIILNAVWFVSAVYYQEPFYGNKLLDFFTVLFVGFGAVFSPLLFLAAVTMFAFSLFRVSESEDGRLIYNPGNPHWKLLKKLFSIEGKISLCEAYWLTVLVVIVGVTAIAVVSLLLFAVLNFTEFAHGIIKLWPLFAFCAYTALLSFIKVRWPNNEILQKGGYIFALGLLVLLLIWVVSFVGVVKFAVFLLLFFTVFGSVILSVYYISSLSQESLLKRLFSTLKSNFCPILFEESGSETGVSEAGK